MVAEPMPLERVILSFPSVITLKTSRNGTTLPRSWNQVAKTGTFHSARYGQFSITKADLAQMLKNFTEVTPKPPTELPVDYDHLSMDPKRVGDGQAAGWMKQLELREGGDELWMEVEWTQEAADAIAQKKYRFVSPSFVKDYTHKDGRKIGTTLLAAAITNHPYLEGMSALTLATPALAGVHLHAALRDLVAEPVVNLAEVGQRVTFIENEEATPELSPAERAQTFLITAIGGGLGDDQFVKLETADGGIPFGWYPAKILAPARVQQDSPQENTPMSTTTTPDAGQKIEARARQLMAERRVDLSTAVKLASAEDDASTQAYLKQFDSGAAQEADAPQPQAALVHNLSRKPDEGFAELCLRTALERRINLRSAVALVSESFPQLADSYSKGDSL